jgi:hypothetical protein
MQLEPHSLSFLVPNATARIYIELGKSCENWVSTLKPLTHTYMNYNARSRTRILPYL